MKNFPTVSVVMPAYNTADYITETVQSILDQTFTDFELIAINDGSVDQTGDILEGFAKLDPRIRVFHQENMGIIETLNRGICLSEGKYIARIDSDDIAHPERLAKQVEFMENNPDVGVSGTRCSFFGDCGYRLGPIPPLNSDAIKCRLLFQPTISHTSVIMRLDLIREFKLYYRKGYEIAEDYELWFRFSLVSRISNIPEVLMKIRNRSESVTRTLTDVGFRSSDQVRLKAIKILGIEPTDEEFMTHLSLADSAQTVTIEHLINVEKWLCKLIDSNREKKVFDEKALAQLLFEKWWFKCCRAPRLGGWAWKTLRHSPLYKGCSIGVRPLLSFGIRCLLKAPHA
jgi:glycosyltransferase involved in cell wall biosynthesis